MAKTGTKGAFKLGESSNGMVVMPMHFVTSSDAAKKGMEYSKIVDYTIDKKKTDNTNDVAVSLTLNKSTKSQIEENLLDTQATFESGYANRSSAVTENHPLFNSESMNLSNHEVSVLRKKLDEAQANGNTLHEMAFSIRGDWLVQNQLYNPRTRDLDQKALKHAERSIVERLFNKGQRLPLGEGPDDVIWFGAIHQDTDHLNMHLWYVKHSKETRPEMLHKQTGEPIGYVSLKEKNRAVASFQNELMSTAIKEKRNQIYESVDTFRVNIRENAVEMLDQDAKYFADLQRIYEALPQRLRGRWRVGNSDSLERTSDSPMAEANKRVGELIDKLLQDELKDDYQQFLKSNDQLDDFTTYRKGEIQSLDTHRISDRNIGRLRKEMANRIYRQFNENFVAENGENLGATDRKETSAGPRENYHRQEKGGFETIKGRMLQRPSIQPGNPQPVAPNNNVTVSRSLAKISRNIVRENRSEISRVRRMIDRQEQTMDQDEDVFETKNHFNGQSHIR